MSRLRQFFTAVAAVAALAAPAMVATKAEARLTLNLGNPVVEPMPFALPTFVDEGGAGDLAAKISQVVAADLAGTGLFEQIPSTAYIQQITSFGAPVSYPDWQAINAQALVTGAVQTSGGQVVVKFRLHDVFANGEMGEGLQFVGTTDSWRRMAHKVADAVYSRITGETGYFDSRVVYVSESGPKNQRQKRLAVMDYDGANTSFLTDSASIVLAPRFSPTGDRILFTSYSSGFPQIYLMDVGSLAIRGLGEQPGTMTFAPRFSPDGRTVVFSLERGGNTDIYSLDIGSGQLSQLTNSPAIETAPSFSPDGSQIVFESDRSGNQQIYIMPARGGEPTRISGGAGRYGTPVWSPRGDYIAFTKQNQGRFHIGVMLTDGTEEKLLTASYLDEGPTWSPNGRVIMFTRQDAGGEPALYSVDVSGRNLRKVATTGAASDPAWSPLLP
ncbi:TolB protein [Gemmobacter caeni]|jgi:TolB protein|uniref:Tol-Pal system protein TolB n=3 Tax=Paracoccaceae TaxID=31989 RepID=A0A2T6AVW6_9RHOB|nr:TolB protein [Gemmobacter caeni]TWI97310.1 TolB protein [Gemmobacter caeni]GHC30487.1 protein TolB [Gemmobacter nanjingensis]